jgi:nitrite reductase/ring-hydroxylating ferredoxin subunit
MFNTFIATFLRMPLNLSRIILESPYSVVLCWGLLMSIFKSIILGRPNGLRQTLLRRVSGYGHREDEDTSPSSSYSAPDSEQGVVAGGAIKMEPPKDITPPDGYEVVLHKDALMDGEIAEVIIAGTSIIVAKVEGAYLAAASTCPNNGGPLVDGTLEGTIITCPYHGWSFDLKDGSCITNPSYQLPVYPALVEGDGVCVQI